MPLMYSCNLEQIGKSTCVSLPRVMLELVPFPFLHFAFSSAKNRRRAEEAMRINLAASGVKFVLFRRQVTTFSLLPPSLRLSLCSHLPACSRSFFSKLLPFCALLKPCLADHRQPFLLGSYESTEFSLHIFVKTQMEPLIYIQANL